MREDTWRLFLDHPLLGTGLGTLEIVFPPYDSLYDGKVVNHAHNDYIEALAETGRRLGELTIGSAPIRLRHLARPQPEHRPGDRATAQVLAPPIQAGP